MISYFSAFQKSIIVLITSNYSGENMLFGNLFKKGLERSRETWFGKVKSLFDRQVIDDNVWMELEEILIAADVGMNTAEKLISQVKQRVRDEKLKDSVAVRSALKEEMVNILKIDKTPVLPLNPPKITLVIGVNGGGKTTSIAKLAAGLKSENKSVLLVAADTFRAAAIDQLKLWGERIGIDVIAHQPGADPGAVVYDALQAAKSRQVQELIIDTAGRLHTKFNLMEELKKVKRVINKIDPAAPHEVLLVIDATTGQNGLAQAKYFTEAVGVTGIFLAKLDGTAKGGIVLAICDELKIPVLYAGVGEKLEDMAKFDATAFVEALFS
jgi:fused signal recognition particle receptor